MGGLLIAAASLGTWASVVVACGLSCPTVCGSSQVVLVAKNLPASVGDIRDAGSIPELGRSPGGRNGNPTPVFLPGEFHGLRSLVGYGP